MVRGKIMKAKHFFLFLPVISLVACQSTPAMEKISEEKALEIAGTSSSSLEDTYPYEFTGTAQRNYIDRDGHITETIKSKRTRKASANNCYYERIVTETNYTGGDKIISYKDYYFVPYETKDDYVLFEKQSSNKSKDVYRVAKIVNDPKGSYFIGGERYVSNDVVMLNSKFGLSGEREDPVVEINEFKDSNERNIEYFTTDGSDVTIKTHMEYARDGNDNVLDFEISYASQGLMGYEETRMVNNQLESTNKLVVKYPSSVKVSLPSDWKKYLEK